MKTAGKFFCRMALSLALVMAFSPIVFATDFEVEIENFTFVPHGTHISVGDTVTWRNRDTFQHSSTSDNGVWDSGLLSLNQTFSFVFTNSGSFPYHCSVHTSMKDTIFVAPLTGVDDNTPNTPARFELAQNYPNPFNARTTIGFSLPQASHVTLEIFNVLGQKVETLFDGGQESGIHEITWDASAQSSGVFFYRVTAGNQTKTGRMTLLK